MVERVCFAVDENHEAYCDRVLFLMDLVCERESVELCDEKTKVKEFQTNRERKYEG